MHRGGFFQAIRATSPESLLYSRMNHQSLKDSKLQIIVVKLYAHPWLNFSLRASLLRQVLDLKRFLSENPEFVQSRSAQEARTALAEGKRVVVLAIETAAGALDSEEDLSYWIDDLGVRIVTLLHLTDDELGGAALILGKGAFGVLSQPWAWVRSLFQGIRDTESRAWLNPRGLEKRGEALLHQLLNRGVWIDLSHSSDAAQEAMFPVLKTYDQPLLYSHSNLREYSGDERAVSKNQLSRIADTGGLLGLMPARDYLGDVPRDSSKSCEDEIDLWAKHWTLALQTLKPEQVFLGSDLNAPLRLLLAKCRASEKFPRGGGVTDIRDFEQLGIEIQKLATKWAPEKNIEHFLRAWNRVKKRP
jgi:microsomal dipeptidase-like Zn-dependent dipeptidase